jgi:starch-binding outer membrane protein, SusD/RagB family
MKNKILVLLFSTFVVFSFWGCEDYLDKSVDDGSDQAIIYTNYNAMLGFLDRIYSEPLLQNIHVAGGNPHGNSNGNSQTGNLADELVNVNNASESAKLNNGNWLMKSSNAFEIGSMWQLEGDKINKTVMSKAYEGIRITCQVIDGVDLVQGITAQQRKYLLGQAHFLRAHFYFELIRRLGGHIKLDKAFYPSDNVDLPRLTYIESSDWMVTDLDKAIEYLPKEWETEHFGRPNQLSALALKSMVQLYTASPLMQNSLTSIVNNGYNRDRAAVAAVAAQRTIDSIATHSYHRLMSTTEYRSIFLVPQPNLYGQPEYLWYNRTQPGNIQAPTRFFWLTWPFTDRAGSEGVPFNAPTQNIVDLCERKGSDGSYYPINDPRSGYDLNNKPYADRDPRFTNNILYPGEAWTFDKNSGKQMYVTTYFGGFTPKYLSASSFTNSKQQTGYMCKKFMTDKMNDAALGSKFDDCRIYTVYIRVAQVYLDFAEASFEATGDAKAVLPGCKMSAEEALNVVRNRVGIGNLAPDLVANPDKFREAYRRERAVELMFENHRWFDIRRWMIAVDLFKEERPIKGIKATPINHSYEAVQLEADGAKFYELKDFKYEIVTITPEVRVFNNRNYWYPFPTDDVASLNNLQQNPEW